MDAFVSWMCIIVWEEICHKDRYCGGKEGWMRAKRRAVNTLEHQPDIDMMPLVDSI